MHGYNVEEIMIKLTIMKSLSATLCMYLYSFMATVTRTAVSTNQQCQNTKAARMVQLNDINFSKYRTYS